jgi:DNA-binding NtrC family response regulator
MDSTSLVVVVDDEPEVRDIAGLIIKNAGYQVETISNNDEERILGLRNRAKLFLIDLGVPLGSGLELVRKLNVKNNPYEVLIMTGGSEFDWFEAARDLGVIGYLHKPFSSKKLVGHVESALIYASRKAEKLTSAGITNAALG